MAFLARFTDRLSNERDLGFWSLATLPASPIVWARVTTCPLAQASRQTMSARECAPSVEGLLISQKEDSGFFCKIFWYLNSLNKHIFIGPVVPRAS